MIAVNRRGFGRSTPFTKEEVEGIILPRPSHYKFTRDAGAEHVRFMEKRAHELAIFLKKLLDQEHEHRITLMGWSMGNLFCLKLWEMISNDSLGLLGEDLRKLLKGLILYGELPPHFLLLSFHTLM